MCTSVRFMSNQNHCFWGRTQEFDVPLHYTLNAIPRGYVLPTETPCEVKYGIVGVGGLDFDFLADGVNEAGLCGGTLYFGNEFRYGKTEDIIKRGKKPVRGEEVLTWILARYATVDEIKENLNKDIAASDTIGTMGVALPQHSVYFDKTGKGIVVEPSGDYEFKIYDNPIGIMTNQPSFDWHMKNLYNYVGMSRKILPGIEVQGEKLLSSGKGNGLFGLPGDFTPQSRFVRAAVLSSLADTPDDDMGISSVFHVLNSFDIPKGVIETVAFNTPHHTQYTVAYDCENRTLYFHNYTNRCIQKLAMREEDMSGSEVVRYAVQDTEEYIEVKNKI